MFSKTYLSLKFSCFEEQSLFVDVGCFNVDHHYLTVTQTESINCSSIADQIEKMSA